ncbi:MAG: hypothetical protein R6U96_14715, partial [Promethearchaeia archaeon]
YANNNPDDPYKSHFYTKSGTEAWSELEGKSGCLKVGLAPISPNPNPQEVNLTVLDQNVNASGFFEYDQLIPHEIEQFTIPVSSLWFSDVTYNANFLGEFEYNTFSRCNYNATLYKDVVWNASISSSQFPEDSSISNKSIQFFKPSYWVYDSAYNGSERYNEASIIKTDEYTKLSHVSNNVWSIIYNQSNGIENIQVKKSSNNLNYVNLGDYANITDWINSSMQTTMKNGIGQLYVYSDSQELTIQSNITNESSTFSLWRPDQDTEVVQNNTLLTLKFLATNGTMAGMEIETFKVVLSELNITLLDNNLDILKNDPAYCTFEARGLSNNEKLDLDNIQITYEKTENTIITLIKDYHYMLEKTDNIYNITIDTSLSDFLAATHSINFSFSEQYYASHRVELSLQIQSRTHNMSILRVNRENRIFNLGKQARYQIHLNDSITDEGIIDADYTLKANFSGTSTEISSAAYEIYDSHNGTYEITLFTDVLYQNKELQNLTIEFYSGKSGIYTTQNVNDSLFIVNDPLETNLDILSNSSTNVVIGESVWISLRYHLLTEANLSDADFSLFNNSQRLDRADYNINEEENSYKITFDLEVMSIGKYNLTIEANKSREDIISYTKSSVTFNFTFSAATFSVEMDPFPEIYADDTSNAIFLNLTYKLGAVENPHIISYFGSNKLSTAVIEPGRYKIFLNSEGCNIGASYEFNITISKSKFNTFFNNSYETITPYPSKITIPEEYQDLEVYQEQTLEVITILKDTFRERDILNATVRMKIEGKSTYSDSFEYLASDFGWYSGSLKIGKISPGTYNLIVEMNATNYKSASANTSISIWEKKSTSMTFVQDLSPPYVRGDTLSLRIKLLAGGKPVIHSEIQIEFVKYYPNGKTEREQLFSTTDENGVAIFNYIIEELEALEIQIVFSGNVEYEGCSFKVEPINIRSKGEQIFLNILPFIPFIIGAAIGVSAYGIKNKIEYKKNLEKWKHKEQIFQDMMNIQYLLVLNKAAGNPIIQDDFGSTELDGTLVSGFLQAITSFIYGIKKEKTDGKEQSHFLFDHQDYKILLEDGKYVRVALVLKERPSDILKEELVKFIRRFESEYKGKLKDFDGTLKHYRHYMKLSTKKLRLTLYKPHVINPKLVKTKLNDFEMDILNITQTFEVLTEKKFNIPELRKYILNVKSDEPKERITATILNLI